MCVSEFCWRVPLSLLIADLFLVTIVRRIVSGHRENADRLRDTGGIDTMDRAWRHAWYPCADGHCVGYTMVQKAFAEHH